MARSSNPNNQAQIIILKKIILKELANLGQSGVHGSSGVHVGVQVVVVEGFGVQGFVIFLQQSSKRFWQHWVSSLTLIFEHWVKSHIQSPEKD